MKPKSINIVGFDMGIKNKLYAAINYYSQEDSKKVDRFKYRYTKVIYDKILLMLKKKIKFHNYSIFKLENLEINQN